MLRRIWTAIAIISALRPMSVHGGLQRVGPLTDGGYLIPAELENIAHCISPGVGHTTAFEDDLLDRFGITSTLVDVAVPPPCRHRHVDALLGANDASETVSLETLLKEARRDFINGGLLLQMDIEGGEWEILQRASAELLSNFSVIVIELHDLHRLRKTSFRADARAALANLRLHFKVIHLHPNNCCPTTRLGRFVFPQVLEVTLLHESSRLIAGHTAAPLPHPLDAPNVPEHDAVVIPWSWKAIWRAQHRIERLAEAYRTRRRNDSQMIPRRFDRR